jgi:hypothetical protein
MKVAFAEDTEQLLCPTCALCGAQMRLIGIEPHPTIYRTDLRTFICTGCDELETETVPLGRVTNVAQFPDAIAAFTPVPRKH